MKKYIIEIEVEDTRRDRPIKVLSVEERIDPAPPIIPSNRQEKMADFLQRLIDGPIYGQAFMRMDNNIPKGPISKRTPIKNGEIRCTITKNSPGIIFCIFDAKHNAIVYWSDMAYRGMEIGETVGIKATILGLSGAVKIG